MYLTLKNLTKNGKNAIYTGAARAITIGITAFAGGTAPASFEVGDGVFAVKAAPKAKRVPLTAEEKDAAKLARKNAPKKTTAERARLAQVRADKLAAKAAAETAAL